MNCTDIIPCEESSLIRGIAQLEKDVINLKKPITSEIINGTTVLIRDSIVIGEINVPTFENSIIFLDAFGAIIPTT